MYLIIRNQTDPFFNLAAEEYLLRNGPDDLVMLWQNEPSVIIGKHQNPFVETDFHYISEHQIPVIRRISGGGTVYHDLGNINFSFIRRVGSVNPVRFSQFTQPILELLIGLGIPVHAGPRNNLLVDGLKFSGNAEHVFRDKVLHHGTILFNTDLEVLTRCLDTAGNRIVSKSIPSVQSRVTDLSLYMKEQISAAKFMELMTDQIQQKLDISGFYKLTSNDISEIKKLSDSKYRSWDWNFGYSPVYSFDLELDSATFRLRLWLKVENGRFTEIVPAELPVGFSWIPEMISGLKQLRHRPEDIADLEQRFESRLSEAGFLPGSFSHKFF